MEKYYKAINGACGDFLASHPCAVVGEWAVMPILY